MMGKWRLALLSVLWVAVQPAIADARIFSGVGSTSIFVHDETRGFDPWSAVHDGDGNVDGVIDYPKNPDLADPTKGVRTLLTEIWYPVRANELGRRATRAIMGDYMLGNRSAFVASHFYMTTSDVDPDRVPVDQTADQALLEAKLALFDKERKSYRLDKKGRVPHINPKGAPYPVVILLHGATVSRAINGSIAEQLARRGYVVVAPDHTGSVQFTLAGSPLDDSPQGALNRANVSFTPCDALSPDCGLYPARYNVFEFDFSPQKIIRLADAINQRVLDLRAVISELRDINAGLVETGAGLQGKLDLDRIGLVGLSLGSIVAQVAKSTIEEIDAYIVAGPVGGPDMRPLVPPAWLAARPADDPMLPPDLGQVPANRIPSTIPAMYMLSGEDEVIAPFALGFGMTGLLPFPMPGNFFPGVRAQYESAVGPALFSNLENAQHASYYDAEAANFPLLYRTEFPSILNYLGADLTYEVVDSRVAHRIGNGVITAFFDRYLKEKPWLLHRLLRTKRLKKLGFTLEANAMVSGK
ncbi:MAG: hypothetical protein KDI63_01575 [Gammaproteobacteria bacterium]|nr:hypothetical protein [Gammaproteobacteria bacterium]